MIQWKRFLSLALALALLAAAGCGKAPDTALEGSVGAGMSSGAGPETPEPSSGEKKLKDFVFIPLWLTSIQEDETKLDLLIGHHLEEVKSVEISYQDVLLDGVAVEHWEVRSPEGVTVFATEPDMGFSQTLTLGVNIEKYTELTLSATASYNDGTEPYPFSATFQISELERRIK